MPAPGLAALAAHAAPCRKGCSIRAGGKPFKILLQVRPLPPLFRGRVLVPSHLERRIAFEEDSRLDYCHPRARPHPMGMRPRVNRLRHIWRGHICVTCSMRRS